IGGGDRLLPARRDRFEVRHRHVAAERLKMRNDRLPKRAAVKKLRAFGREAFERGCEVGLLQDAPGRKAAASIHVDAREFPAEGVALDRRTMLVGLIDVEFDEREAVTR